MGTRPLGSSATPPADHRGSAVTGDVQALTPTGIRAPQRHSLPITKSPQRVSTMDANPPPQKYQARVISPLGTAIEVVNFTRLVSGMTPATAACFCVIILLTLIRVRLLFSIDSLLLHVERV